MASQDQLDAAIKAAAEGTPPPAAKVVQMSTANIKVTSGRVFQLAFPIEATDADLLDLIKEITMNLPQAIRREKHPHSNLVVPGVVAVPGHRT